MALNKISKFDTLYRGRYQPHASRNYSVLSLFNKFLLPCSRQNNMLTVWRELASWVLLETRPLRSYKTVRSTQYVGSIVDQYIQHLNKIHSTLEQGSEIAVAFLSASLGRMHFGNSKAMMNYDGISWNYSKTPKLDGEKSCIFCLDRDMALVTQFIKQYLTWIIEKVNK